MDLWIVAAATGAGYVAKYWKNNQSKDVDSSSDLSFGESNLVSSQNSNHFLNKFAPRNKQFEDFSDDEKLGFFGTHQDFIMPMKSWIDESSEEQFGESSKMNKMGNEIGVLVCNSSVRSGSWRSRSTSKGRFSNGGLVKPLSFVDDSHFESVGKREKGLETKSRSCSNLCEDFASKGAQDESFILYLGFFIGMIYSSISNNSKVHKLKEMLKQTENLVQDLQEEFEMEDSMKLKELSNDNCESYTFSNNVFSEKTGADSSPKHKAKESSEAMSRIEAELEAELERLGLNINTEGTDRFSDDDEELDQEFEVDFGEGELRNEMISEESCSWKKAIEEATIQSGNYSVSPRELSLRLHEVIQSRLEDRIKELENALRNNNRELQLLDTEFSNLAENGELQFISNQSCPNSEDENKIAILEDEVFY